MYTYIIGLYDGNSIFCEVGAKAEETADDLKATFAHDIV